MPGCNPTHVITSRHKGQRANPVHELLQKPIGTHEHCEVPCALNRYKLLLGCLNGIQIVAGKYSGRREVLIPLEEKYRDREFHSEFLRSHRLRLTNQLLGAETLAGSGVVDVFNGTAGCNQREAKGPCQKPVRTFEEIGPFPLYAVSWARGIRRWADFGQLIEGTLISNRARLLEQGIVRDGVILSFVGYLASSDVGEKEVRPGLHHPEGENRTE